MELLAIIMNFGQYLVEHYPWAAQVLIWMGAFRLIFKPLCSFIDQLVIAIPGEKDNLAWEKVKASGIYKAVAYLVDFFMSVKLPQEKK